MVGLCVVRPLRKGEMKKVLAMLKPESGGKGGGLGNNKFWSSFYIA